MRRLIPVIRPDWPEPLGTVRIYFNRLAHPGETKSKGVFIVIIFGTPGLPGFGRGPCTGRCPLVSQRSSTGSER